MIAYYKRCVNCHSSNTGLDATASFDKDEAVWVLASVYGESFCRDCEGDAGLYDEFSPYGSEKAPTEEKAIQLTKTLSSTDNHDTYWLIDKSTLTLTQAERETFEEEYGETARFIIRHGYWGRIAPKHHIAKFKKGEPL